MKKVVLMLLVAITLISCESRNHAKKSTTTATNGIQYFIATEFVQSYITHEDSIVSVYLIRAKDRYDAERIYVNNYQVGSVWLGSYRFDEIELLNGREPIKTE